MRPKISEREFEERRRKVQDFMAERNLDLLLLYADDRYVYGQAYARWMIDYQPQFEAALVLVPAKGEIALVTGAESVEFALHTSRCRTVYATPQFLHPNEDYPYCEVTSFEEVIARLEAQSERKIRHIGVAGKAFIPYDLFMEIVEKFGNEWIHDVEEALSMLRAVKTEEEISVIRYAYQIAEKGMDTLHQKLREGISERELAAEAEYEMRKMGSEGMGIETMINSGPANTSPILSRTTFRELQRSDLVVATLAPRYEGYHGAVGRPFVLGEAPKEIQAYIELVMSAQEETMKSLGPGMTGKEMDAISRNQLEKAGFGKNFAYTGIHSVGVIEFEQPILSSKCDVVLKPNMVFSIDIPLFLNKWGGMRLENGYLVTEHGCEPLNTWDRTYIKPI
ncbi:MAG: Xaa-Pro peptidase family protein [Faecalicatena sp.]|uniref:M24 family metallopeptidase n=1 Tax=Faecalicatena sp. TaxID=2005360 RepID=UPI00259036B9|nr:Xaa-Pro peptidase family protein [Faecalicatena sp.]MCI6466973.1 Xaa-Pro peptidase family protein [Faecalicatena sp.]MDY5617681.1 Xaa-Pro peptidase family protein [Lachnospiraceae bacterium]